MTDESMKKSAKKWGINLISGLFAIALALLFVIVLRGIAVQITPPPEPRNEPYPDVSTKEMVLIFLALTGIGMYVFREKSEFLSE